jgi:hypothetical protein
VPSASQQPTSKPIERPDFSGTWNLGTANPGGRSGEIEGLGNSPAGQLHVGVTAYTLVISQSADKVRIEEHRQPFASPPVNTLEYALHGEPVKNLMVIESIRNAPSRTTTTWNQTGLVSNIDVFVTGESNPRQYMETISIRPNGDLAVRIQRVGTADSRTLLYRKVR